MFVRIVVALMSYDSAFLVSCLVMYVLPVVFPGSFGVSVFPVVVPYVLPLMQIALTGNL